MNYLIYGTAFIYLIICVLTIKKVKLNAKSMCIIGIVTAMTLVLRTIRVPLPTGASIALLGVLPPMLLALTYNCELAVLSGLISALLSIIVVPGYALVHPMQLFVEHIPALSILGFAGVLGCEKKVNVIAASLGVIIINVTFHIFSGSIFFGQYAPPGLGPWAYSITYNISSHGVEGIIAVILLSFMPLKNIKKVIGGRSYVINQESSK